MRLTFHIHAQYICWTQRTTAKENVISHHIWYPRRTKKINNQHTLWPQRTKKKEHFNNPHNTKKNKKKKHPFCWTHIWWIPMYIYIYFTNIIIKQNWAGAPRVSCPKNINKDAKLMQTNIINSFTNIKSYLEIRLHQSPNSMMLLRHYPRE